MRYHFFFGFPYRKVFYLLFCKLWIFLTLTFTSNWCSVSFFSSFRSVSTVHDGGMDGWRMDA